MSGSKLASYTDWLTVSLIFCSICLGLKSRDGLRIVLIPSFTSPLQMGRCPLWSLNPHLKESSKALLISRKIKNMTMSLRHSGSRIGTSGTDTNWNWQNDGCIIIIHSVGGVRRRTSSFFVNNCIHAHMWGWGFRAVIMYVHRLLACFDVQELEKVCLCQQCQVEWFVDTSLDYQDLQNSFTYLCSYWRSSSPHRLLPHVLIHATLQLSAPFNSIRARVNMEWWKTCVSVAMCVAKAQEKSVAHLASAVKDWSACKAMKKDFRNKIYGIIHRSVSLLLHQVSWSRLYKSWYYWCI